MLNSVKIEDLFNESDVEQKFIYPLLTQSEPLGLGFSSSDIRTKTDIRKIGIDKGNKRAIYYPDYLIVMAGLPLIIIEAKDPNTPLDDAIKEARLYASEINSKYPSGFNPCSKIIMSNGSETLFTTWDSTNEIKSFKFEEADITSESFFNFVEFASKKTSIGLLKQLQSSIRKDTLFLKPTGLLGGTAIQNASLGENSFGSNISFEYRHLFNPTDKNERTSIAINAYVASKRRLSHVDPIDRLIRSTLTPSYRDSRLIANTDNPVEVISALSKSHNIKNQILLIIGSVGSGKSTFIDYLREVALPEDLKKRTFWLSVNMNDSPKVKELIYDWVLEQSIVNLQESFKELDFASLELLKKIFAQPISQFEKGPISIFPKLSEKYLEELYILVSDLHKDRNKFFKYLIEYLIISRGSSLIFVLDNVDKRDRDSQLLMFEVASWLKSQFHCTVFLPLREVTFDNYRKEPPLDTVIKDFVFRIDPPLLEQVIYKRFHYLTREISTNRTSFHYLLKNGYKVECKREEIANYLSAILKSLFQNKFFKRLIIGLTDRDIRRGLEIFLDFCKSGHFQETDILKMRLSAEDYELPNHLITRILLRGNRRYFSDGSSPIRNLFHSYHEDSIPDPYVRIAILKWLEIRKSISGPSNTKGYHKIDSLVKDLSSLGHTEKRIINELEIFVKSSCVITESQSLDLSYENLICITAAGVVHLELLNNVDYLSTVSEDTYFRNLQVAEAIKENIAGKDVSLHFSKENTIENSKLLLDYLTEYKKYYPIIPEAFLEDNQWEDLHSLSKSFQVIEHLERSRDINNELLFEGLYPPGEIIEGEIVSIKDYGIFIEFGLGAKGFVHISSLTKQYNPTYIEENYEIGEIIIAEIIEFEPSHGRFKLKL